MPHSGAVTVGERARYKFYRPCRTASLWLAKKGPGTSSTGHVALRHCDLQRKGQVQVLQPMSHCGAFTGKERARYKLYSCCRTAALLLAKKGPGIALCTYSHCGTAVLLTDKERVSYRFCIQTMRHCGASYWQRKGQLQVLHTGNAALRCFLLTKEGPGTGFAVSAALCREEAEWAAVGGALVLDGRQVLVRTVRRIVATVRVLKYTELINDTVS